MNAARDLRNHEGGKLQLGMVVRVLGQRARDLLWRCDAEVDEVVSMHAMRVINVEQRSREVGAVVEEQIEVADVAAVVESIHKLLIFFWCRLDLKTVDPAVVGCTDKLRPFAAGSFASFFPPATSGAMERR